MKKSVFLKNAFIMVISSFLLRFSGMWFRVFLAEKIGAIGMGTYQLIFSVFTMSISLATSGMFLLTVRLVSECIGRNEKEKIRSTVSKCIRYGLFMSIIASFLLFSLSPLIAKYILTDQKTEIPLKILAFGLPFMSSYACLKGYFVANRNTFHSSVSEILEQFITVFIPYIFLLSSPSLEKSLIAIMIGSSFGEVSSFLYMFIAYKISVHKKKLQKEKSERIIRKILHICVPGTISSTAKNLLSTIENILLPFSLRKSGDSASLSLERYGVLHGMSYPTLLFPSAILFPFSSLLVPEIARANAQKDKDAVFYYISFSLKFSLCFSIPLAFLFFKYAPDLSFSLYNNAEAGDYMRILAPLIPLLYTDFAVDGILKGLDEQIASCKCNVTDGIMRISLIFLLVPKFKITGYVFVLFISCIFNAFLSLLHLLKVSEFKFPIGEFVLIPIFFSVFSIFIAEIFPLSYIPKIIISVSTYIFFTVFKETLKKTEEKSLPSFLY